MSNIVIDEQKNRQYLLFKIRSKFDSFPPAIKRVALFVTSHPQEAVYMNISDMAKACNVSDASVTNFVRQIECSSFREFKICMANNDSPVLAGDTFLYGQVSLSDSPQKICEKVFASHIDAIRNTLHILDCTNLDKVASQLARARRVDIYGQSSSYIVAQHFANRLMRIGVRVSVYDDPHTQISSASLLDKNDLAIGISNSGQSPEIMQALKISSLAGAQTVCVTSKDGSPISKLAQVVLFTAADDSEIIEDLPSRAAEMALFNALYICVASHMKKKALANLYKVSDVLEEKKAEN